MASQKIKVANPIVEMDGETQILSLSISPLIDLFVLLGFALEISLCTSIVVLFLLPIDLCACACGEIVVD